MIKKSLPVFLFFVFGVMSCVGQNQGINNIWLSGYQSQFGYPGGNSRVDFSNGSFVVSSDSLPMSFSVAHANISDTASRILFYTNGIYIADSTNQQMLNGGGLNPSQYTTWYINDGLAIPQADLIIRKPDSQNIYYLFHGTIDNTVDYFANYLYLTTIDMNLNNGKGQVIAKNQIKIQDALNGGKITACKHGNGRDWWVFCHKAYSNIFYSLLVTPFGIMGPYQQSIGIVRPPDVGQMVFSPDGMRLAYYETIGDLALFDFDRCSGQLSNPRHVAINDNALGGGCAFSPNSNVLYLSSSRFVYQFDATASNLAASQITVAVWDSFCSPVPGFPALPTYFYLSALAPDGKIYITTGNSGFHMHVINNPDNLGIACNLIQHGIVLPRWYFNTLPNHPNYFLGRDTGSVCDTITSWVGLTPNPSPKERGVTANPNPNNGNFTLWFSVHDKPGWLDVYDVNGNLILHEGVAPWSQYKQVDIIHQLNGIYFCKMLWGSTVQSVKVIKN